VSAASFTGILIYPRIIPGRGSYRGFANIGGIKYLDLQKYMISTRTLRFWMRYETWPLCPLPRNLRGKLIAASEKSCEPDPKTWAGASKERTHDQSTFVSKFSATLLLGPVSLPVYFHFH
jgi:hypothetical protein